MGRIQSLDLILAGGNGTRLFPLTIDRAKPAVPFGGKFRVIDFVLSNAYNSGSRQIIVLTQPHAENLEKYIQQAWDGVSEGGIDFIHPARSKPNSPYSGNANAVYQNRRLIENSDADVVDILSADHAYIMDYSQLNVEHLRHNADLTVAALQVPLDAARGKFGVFEVDRQGHVKGFEEKPLEPKPILGDEAYCWASMGIYAFNPNVLLEELAKDTGSGHSNRPVDFGHDVIPQSINRRKVMIYDYDKNTVPGVHSKPYWRDIGNLDDYYEANMDILGKNPKLQVGNEKWPIRAVQANLGKPTISDTAVVENSIIAGGVEIGSSTIVNSVISPGVKVGDYVSIVNSILLGNSTINDGSKIRYTIVDKNVNVPVEVFIGVSPQIDIARGFIKTSGGRTIVQKGYQFMTI